MQVTILGSGGQLGRELTRAPWPVGLDLRAWGRHEVDITDERAAAEAVRGADLVVNAGAYTAVDKAETETERAFEVNRDGPANLARACAEQGAWLLQVSTDYVFDGTKSGAYAEDDPTAPLGVYGASKAEGEERVRELCEQHVILRTSWVVSAFGQNFVKTMLRLAAERDRLRVVADQFGRPTPARDLADAIVRIAARLAEAAPISAGTYHFAAAGRASWHELASFVVDQQAARTGRRPVVEPITTAEYPTPARRPASSVLATTKLEQALGFTPAAWQRGAAEIVDELLSEHR